MKSISVFEMIKVGIGPSSSHTMGPWLAGSLFLQFLEAQTDLSAIAKVKTHLYGSLALTGIGHGTDIAVLMGLSGEDYVQIDTDEIPAKVAKIRGEERMYLGAKKWIPYREKEDLLFHFNEFLPYHANGLRFEAFLEDGSVLSETYYSVGGGFVATEEENTIEEHLIKTPYPCHKGASILRFCADMQLSVSDLVLLNEQAWQSEAEVRAQALFIWEEIKACIYRGIRKKGVLPGGLGVKRRAAELCDRLTGNMTWANQEEWMEAVKKSGNDFAKVNKWISCFALAVNEENASFGRVITAPTNGASGVIPAVLMYGRCFANFDEEKIIRFLLVAGEIGTIFKKNATISAAAGGCQAEIGVSSAMAAAGLTECLGGDPEQVLMAAEIAMEHHLGMTCDPIGGLVQIPCIERNSMGAIKAITACNIALESDPRAAKVSLDAVIRSMWDTARDMNSKYKETSEGGLAVNIAVNVPEC